MIQNYSRYRTLQAFFRRPRKDFQMRELSRLTRLAQPSIRAHLQALIKEGLILRETKGLYPSFRANRDHEIFRIYKCFDLVLDLHRCGLLDRLYDACLPDAIILFGSASRGEDTEESDIDIFVQAKEKKLDLKRQEAVMGRKISLFFEEDFSKLSTELKNNLVNGLILKGYLRAF